MSRQDFIGRRRSRDLAFLEQFDQAQRLVDRGADHEASQDCAIFASAVRQAIGRGCSLDEICWAVRELMPTRAALDESEFVLGDTLMEEPTRPERPSAKTKLRIRKTLLARLAQFFTRDE